MPLEVANTVEELNPAWPTGVDPISEGDDHIRLIKQVLQNSLPNLADLWTTDQPIYAGSDPGDPDAVVINSQLQINSHGWVDSDGTILGGSGDFTVAKIGVGAYELTFTEVASGQYDQAISVTPVGLPGFSNMNGANVALVSGSVIQVQIGRPTSTYEDQAFGFARFAS